MEDASKALIIAASVLLGVMIISIAVYLFSIYGDYSESAYQKMEDAQISQFNTQFLKYYGTTTDSSGNIKSITCTIHDIISLANLAQENNIQYELKVNSPSNYASVSEDTMAVYYVQISLGSSSSTRHLENLTEEGQVSLLKENSTKSYKCNLVKTSTITKRVYYMHFVEI